MSIGWIQHWIPLVNFNSVAGDVILKNFHGNGLEKMIFLEEERGC